MDADEKLLALKKAYADIILNTSKEAAARIIVSERKAFRFQHELAVAKGEALQMMLRLKNMMDSKFSEAEMISRNQQAKIEELEAQLDEAEDIVRDLREELSHVQAKLEGVINDKVQCLDEHDSAIPEEALEENRLYNSQSIIYPLPESQHDSLAASDTKTSYLSQTTEFPNCYNALIHIRNTYGAKTDLPSIILRSKKHEFYRNGCTQRIRAVERNPLDGELSLSTEPNDVKRKIDEEDKSICPGPTDEVDNICKIEKKKAVEEDSRLSSRCQVRANKSFRRKRKRAAKYRKNRIIPRRKHLPDQFTKISCSNTSLNSVKNSGQPEEDPVILAPNLSAGISYMGTQPECAEVTENNKECVKEHDVENVITNDEALIEVPVIMGQECDGDNVITSDEAFIEIPVTMGQRCDVENVITKDEALIEIPVTMGRDGGPTKSSIIRVSKIDLEEVDEPIVHSESKSSDETDEIPSQPVNHSVIKYTFQRKRKREPLRITDGNVLLENSAFKRKKEEKQNDSAEPEKSCLVTKSTRRSWRLAQIAHEVHTMRKNGATKSGCSTTKLLDF